MRHACKCWHAQEPLDPSLCFPTILLKLSAACMTLQFCLHPLTHCMLKFLPLLVVQACVPGAAKLP